MIYSEKVMDHFTNPRNVGEIVDANGVGEVGNAKCGDIMKVYLKVENNVVVDAKFKTFGCGSAIASSSMATELIKGKTVEEAWDLTNLAVAEALDGLPPIKMHCSVLAEEAIHKAINDYRVKEGLTPWDFKETDHDELHANVHGE
ncbi:FeS cluster assembly scaffold protein NifU [Clostridium argentinense CDC 2741]|uniref:FeS cluster assembly scaffold protein NifU n=1 Tax=Clostridium argentinense CDC 2741 TaxID=1418104 RepID=A0A0C1U478_9CLOT|nr:Fe-S cluster assembly scaffold protein NifU [Clostridium argentinense]HAG43494.1 Fe-S cluster assembly scaffold protein NifU [Clostridium sp.]ARC84618.1 iron-sulfur cluster assembly scaffold protein NifU [Clostridium argentinense]KIE47599.1 FeS cluster assembly scaffold protein NifU [Clostridium argentinense CDC 2741]NFF40124.1 Fe-S cluster assembly scaffold protein NifU [Clostridium argentinense]NFP50673.1 Fe-S cluster assembly scaffold protein NifU [Clostridium argentinense]